MSERRYYHGGVPGLKAGNKILPPSVTGRSTLLKYSETHPACVQRRDRVYLTSSLDAAKMFAFSYPFGTVYEVEPDHPVEHDPDCIVEGLSFQCPSATVKRVVAVGVGRDVSERKAILSALMG